jgi:hypothetical protein
VLFEASDGTQTADIFDGQTSPHAKKNACGYSTRSKMSLQHIDHWRNWDRQNGNGKASAPAFGASQQAVHGA